MNILFKTAKYVSVGRVTLNNQLVYFTDFLVRSIFLLIILYIFIQLWSATFDGEGLPQIAGYSFEQIIWYLIFAESITMACPSMSAKIEEEVKSGDVAYKLIRPVSYIGFHFVSYLGEVVFRLMINLLIGGFLGFLVLGWPEFGLGWLGFFIVAVGALSINFILNMMVALCSFWVEETRGLEFVYHKFLFTIGGMLMPLEVFPHWLQQICSWLPFQAILYFPAKTAVKFDGEMMLAMLGIQFIWIMILGGCLMLMFRKGVKKLNVNGG